MGRAQDYRSILDYLDRARDGRSHLTEASMKDLRETLDDARAAGKRVLVVGLGISGIESARFLTNRGLKVTVVERNAESRFREHSSFAAELPDIQARGVAVVFGVDGERVAPHLNDIGLAVLSPGVPLESAIVGTLRRHGVAAR